MKIASPNQDLTVLWMAFKERGSEGAFRLLMESSYGTLYNYGRKFSKDEAFIKDCIQEVFIAIWQYGKSLDVPASPKAYLLTSLRRKMMNLGRKGNWVLPEDQPEALFAEETTPESLMAYREAIQEQVRLVAGLLEKLSDRQREAIYLRFYQGLSRAEIADVMNISEQSVSNTLQKALHALRKAYPVDNSLMLLLLAAIFRF